MFDELKYKYQRSKKGYGYKDIWSLDYWFMTTMRPMLIEFKKNHVGSPACLGENYVDDKGMLVNDTCHNEWDKILDKMIFLLGEMNDETRTKTNPYEEEWEAALDKFHSLYGDFGEKLMTEDEIARHPKTGGVIHTMREVPEFEPISTKFYNAAADIEEYKENCKNEFFKLFSKYFYNLWD